jgi:hypothetical protein
MVSMNVMLSLSETMDTYQIVLSSDSNGIGFASCSSEDLFVSIPQPMLPREHLATAKIQLALTQSVPARREHRVISHECLRTCMHTLQDLVRGKTLVADHVPQELHHVGLEVVHVASSNEAVHPHLSVPAIVELPARVSDVDVRDWLSRCADGHGAAERGQPDHDLEFGRATGGRCGEHVVGSVCNELMTGVVPGP